MMTPAEHRAYRSGRWAYDRQKPRTANPFVNAKGGKYQAWLRGWDEALADWLSATRRCAARSY